MAEGAPELIDLALKPERTGALWWIDATARADGARYIVRGHILPTGRVSIATVVREGGARAITRTERGRRLGELVAAHAQVELLLAQLP